MLGTDALGMRSLTLGIRLWTTFRYLQRCSRDPIIAYVAAGINRTIEITHDRSTHSRV